MEKMYSYHSFLFPFRFDYVARQVANKEELYREYSFQERVDIAKAKRFLESSGWEYEPFRIDSDERYSESAYYYDYVNEALFNKEKFDAEDISWNFVKKFTDAQLHFKIFQSKEYALEIEQISLRIFFSGVAIVVIAAKNCKYEDLEDILRINEYARRVYPQFLPLEDVKDTFLPDWITIRLDKESVTENFQKYNRPRMYGIGKHILWLLGGHFSNRVQKECFFIQPILDDRMFVVSWYGSEIAKDIAKEYEKNDLWYRYVFVDGGNKTVQDEKMQKELIEKATYTRWKNDATLYGVSRYSFVALCDGEWFCANVIFNHMKHHYKDMALYVLANRATMVRFFDEIRSIARLKREQEQFYDRTKELYYLYLEFMSRLFFREITPQDQGIELYQKLLGWFDFDKDIKDLENEIEKLHNIADMELTKQEQEGMNLLSKIGFWLLPPSLLAGFLGMNIFGGEVFRFSDFPHLQKCFHQYPILSAVISFFAVLIVGFGMGWMLEKIFKNLIAKSKK